MAYKRYSEKFKIEAIRQITEQGLSFCYVADRHGITNQSLYSWLKKYGPRLTDKQTEKG